MKTHIFVMIGMLMYCVLSLCDRFFVHINDMIYIPGVIIAILFMFIGILKVKR